MEHSRPTYPCPACGFLTMDEPPGSYNICVMCGWEDDHVQLAHPTMGGGANRESLVEAQSIAVKRHPLTVQSYSEYVRDPAWRPWSDGDDGAAPRTGKEYLDAAAEVTPDYYWRRS